MALVEIYGTLQDDLRALIPPGQYPRLFLVKEKPTITRFGGLQPNLEVQATYNQATGFFRFTVESGPGIRYRLFVDWLPPGQELELPENRSRDRVWWPQWIYPGDGGGISSLPQAPLTPDTVWVGLTPPPHDWPGFWLYSPGPGEVMPLDDPRIGDLIQGPGPWILTR